MANSDLYKAVVSLCGVLKLSITTFGWMLLLFCKYPVQVIVVMLVAGTACECAGAATSGVTFVSLCWDLYRHVLRLIGVVVERSKEERVNVQVPISFIMPDLEPRSESRFSLFTDSYDWFRMQAIFLKNAYEVYFSKFEVVEMVFLAFGVLAIIFLSIVILKKMVYGPLTKLVGKLLRLWQRTKDVFYTGVERVMVGSEFWDDKIPSFQAEVYVASENSGFSFAGNGFCFQYKKESLSVFMTAAHVVDNASMIRLKTSRGAVEFKHSDWLHNFEATDVSMVALTNDVKSTLGLSSGKMRNVANGQRATTVKIVSQGKSSLGDLLVAEEDFGRVKYMGSTRRGFSGAPYFTNGMIFGMHTGCRSFNIGYDAAFLTFLVKNALHAGELVSDYVIPESSEDWVEEELLKGRAHKIVRTGNGDEFDIMLHGQYFRVDDEDLRKIMDKADRRNIHLNFMGEDFEAQRLESYSENDGEMIRIEEYERLSAQCKMLIAQVQLSQEQIVSQRKIIVDMELGQYENAKRPFPASQLPTMPPGSVCYNDKESENLAGPSVNAGATGSQKDQASARRKSGTIPNRPMFNYREDPIWGSSGQESMLAQRKSRSRSIKKGSNSRSKGAVPKLASKN